MEIMLTGTSIVVTVQGAGITEAQLQRISNSQVKKKNEIIINPELPADVLGKAYRDPADANTYIAAQSPTSQDGYTILY